MSSNRPIVSAVQPTPRQREVFVNHPARLKLYLEPVNDFGWQPPKEIHMPNWKLILVYLVAMFILRHC
jgi:hypothetical protein